MKSRNASLARLGLSVRLAAVAAGLALFASCGGSSSSSSTPPPSQTNNTQAVQVNAGPGNVYGPNGLFTSVTVCVPNSSSCQTISNVIVDTGSYGLRLLQSQVTVALPVTTDTSGDPLQECVAFADGSYTWGPVATATMEMAGETTAGGSYSSGVPLQLISASDSFAPPSDANSCNPNNTGTPANTVQLLGANGILGVGPFQQDCGTACTGTEVPEQYYICPTTGCVVAAVPLADQLTNPVFAFTTDNNGLEVSLPSVSATGTSTLPGYIYFGIGTQSDNALGSANLYTTDAYGNVGVTFNGVTYSGNYLDTGSNGLYILDASTLNIPTCLDYTYFYCPGSTQNYSATVVGANSTSNSVSFSIANADSLFSANPSFAVFVNLGGPNRSDVFDFGLPFFYGRNVFVGIEGENSPTGVAGPYWAF